VTCGETWTFQCGPEEKPKTSSGKGLRLKMKGQNKAHPSFYNK